MQSFGDCSPVDILHCQHEYNPTVCHWNNSYRTEVKLTGRDIRSNINIIIIKYILTGCNIFQRLWYIIISRRTVRGTERYVLYDNINMKEIINYTAG